MCQMNVLEAKTNFSKIIAMLENHEEEEVIVARAGHPVVRISLVPSLECLQAKWSFLLSMQKIGILVTGQTKN